MAAGNTQAELARSDTVLRFKKELGASTLVPFRESEFVKASNVRGKWFKTEQSVICGHQGLFHVESSGMLALLKN